MIRIRLIGTLLIAMQLAGCAGTRTFSTAARAGDTVAVTIGWNANLAKSQATVVIVGGGNTYTYPPGDPNVRLIAQFYPDPLSKLIVGRETGQSLGVNAANHAAQLESAVTGSDKDYAQSTLIVNLPATLPVGTATVQVFNQAMVAVAPAATVTVLPGTGSPNSFQGPTGSLTPEMLSTLERADFKTVKFSGSTVPYALQLDVTRTAGTGVPWLANPRGDLKTLSWSDTGSRIKVVLMPSNSSVPSSMSAFKFMIAGGVTGLAVDAASLRAFDSNGNAITGVTAAIQ